MHNKKVTDKRVDSSIGATIGRRDFMGGTLALSALASPVAALAAEGEAAMPPPGPRDVHEIENVWIPMADGTKLAARMWLPRDADQHPVPAILAYLPYRKRDLTRLRDEQIHPYLASHGYACVRVDIRGSGDSEGQVLDEYVRQEQDDGVEVIAWLAGRPWCTGKVGMFGISWGGFNSLQIAARNPPALKAIITHCSTDDRYTDDAHYIGGCIVQDMFVWGALYTEYVLRPPDPAIVGEDRWRDMWRQRLESMDFFLGDWLEHQHRDAFWKHGSVRENYGAIQCPVYAVGGWVDAYSSAVPRLLANLQVPRKGLIGPWGHQLPHQGFPGPAIDWLSEALRWWDHWLKDEDTGIMEEPMLRAWMQYDVAAPGMKEVPGRWVTEAQWPVTAAVPRRYFLNAGGMDSAPANEKLLSLQSPQTVGVTAPHWCPFDMSVQLPVDQRVDDGRSLTFDSAPLDTDFEILGAPVVNLELSVDKPVAFISVRLNEVAPTGESRRVTYHVRNLTHRDSHEHPKAMEPGKRYSVRLPLHDCAHRFKAGHRLRIAISTTYWPLIWPSPEPVTLSVVAGRSTLELPVRTARDSQPMVEFGKAFVPKSTGTARSQEFEKPESLTEDDKSLHSILFYGNKIFEWDVEKARLRITSGQETDPYRIMATDTKVFGQWSEVTEIDDNDPSSVILSFRRQSGLSRSGWDVRVSCQINFSLTQEDFLLSAEVKTYEKNEPFFSKTWERKIPRHLV